MKAEVKTFFGWWLNAYSSRELNKMIEKSKAILLNLEETIQQSESEFPKGNRNSVNIFESMRFFNFWNGNMLKTRSTVDFWSNLLEEITVFVVLPEKAWKLVVYYEILLSRYVVVENLVELQFNLFKFLKVKLFIFCR